MGRQPTTSLMVTVNNSTAPHSDPHGPRATVTTAYLAWRRLCIPRRLHQLAQPGVQDVHDGHEQADVSPRLDQVLHTAAVCRVHLLTSARTATVTTTSSTTVSLHTPPQCRRLWWQRRALADSTRTQPHEKK